MRKKGRIGSSFDDFRKEEGIYEEVTARAIKRLQRIPVKWNHTRAADSAVSSSAKAASPGLLDRPLEERVKKLKDLILRRPPS